MACCTHPTALSIDPFDLSSATAMRVFPLAHKYDIQTLLGRCTKAMVKGLDGKDALDPKKKKGKIVDTFNPDVFQWLAVADRLHCTPIIRACLEHLQKQPSSADADKIQPEDTEDESAFERIKQLASRCSAIRELLSFREYRAVLEGLRVDTVLDIMTVMVGLPVDYKVGDSMPGQLWMAFVDVCELGLDRERCLQTSDKSRCGNGRWVHSS
jgi:hypothetical protein